MWHAPPLIPCYLGFLFCRDRACTFFQCSHKEKSLVCLFSLFLQRFEFAQCAIHPYKTFGPGQSGDEAFHWINYTPRGPEVHPDVNAIANNTPLTRPHRTCPVRSFLPTPTPPPPFHHFPSIGFSLCRWQSVWASFSPHGYNILPDATGN